ncbi:MAG: LapA family protein [Alphaproteobacteria bacterium]|nr:LapA family protein [Alphaproteobacteria bacterium]
MRFLARLFALAFALFAILFAATNHEEVTLRLWPLPYVATLPIYVTVLGAAVLGFLAGVLALWPSFHRLRRAFRRETRAVAALEEEAARLRELSGAGSAAKPSVFRRLRIGGKGAEDASDGHVRH